MDNSVPNNFSFEKPVIIVGGGHVDEDCLSKLLARGYGLIAADGGANQFYNTDIVPDVIIGDMDSLEHIDHWNKKTVVLDIEEQDSTDFEKCLALTNAPLYIGFGLIGKRFDHSLATIHAMARFATQKTIVLVDETDVIFAARGKVELTLEKGARVSIYPFGKISFENSKGLKYPLDNLVMEQGVQIGTSNEAISNIIEITPSNTYATFKVIVPKRFIEEIIAAGLAS
ncbi:MAG: thiamine diphosphokinase [Rhizobiaceae bacterium]|nr:thiamine diphosphokinase [Rhizobiaceae bacterium]